MRLLIRPPFAALLSLLLTGCGDTDWPATAPVSGTVTWNGKPIANVHLSFRSPGAPRFGSGTTDLAGKYSLTTFQPNDGAIIGEHRVAVRMVATPSSEQGPLPDFKDTAAFMKAAQAAEKPVKNPAVPPRFGSPATTPLRATVKPGDNVIDFDLSDG